jgi:hypothetical protein
MVQTSLSHLLRILSGTVTLRNSSVFFKLKHEYKFRNLVPNFYPREKKVVVYPSWISNYLSK